MSTHDPAADPPPPMQPSPPVGNVPQQWAPPAPVEYSAPRVDDLVPAHQVQPHTAGEPVSPPPPPQPQSPPPPANATPSSTQPPPPAGGHVPPAAPAKRSVGKLVTIILLSLALVGALGVLAMYIVQLDEANSRISEQQREIEDQRDLIDKKEIFGAAMTELLDTAKKFDGALMGDVVPFSDYEDVARQSWEHRWNGALLDADTDTVRASTQELTLLREKADAEFSSNSTGSTYEAVIDQLGGGLVASQIDDADVLCQTDVLACVVSDNPYVVHFDAESNQKPYLNEWLRTGIAYHEFAHALQFTNPGPTETALTAFDGDHETMADCFALTYLDGWTLDHRIDVSRYSYWDVSIGYGYTCNDTQRQAIKDWYGQLGYTTRPISQ